ncbi:MAG: periplasmic binding protein, partial [Paenibacillus sp.]|nr:periplasmic binding protein [Paenibacillus sp.]
MLKLFKPFLLTIAFTLMLAGCGSSNSGSSTSSGTTDNKGTTTPAAGSNNANSTAPATKTIKHAMGTADIKGVPAKIVILEWNYAENLLALGLQPV